MLSSKAIIAIAKAHLVHADNQKGGNNVVFSGMANVARVGQPNSDAEEQDSRTSKLVLLAVALFQEELLDNLSDRSTSMITTRIQNDAT